LRTSLRQRLRHLDPARYRQLHRYAADWFEHHGFSVEAIRHAVEYADPEVVAGVMERVGGIRLSLHQGTSVLRLFHPQSDNAAASYPLVTLGQIYLKAQDGRIDEARASLSDISQRDVPVLTIAMDAGFQSIGPFNRAFKVDTGLTPTEFRRDALARSKAAASKSDDASAIGQLNREIG